MIIVMSDFTYQRECCLLTLVVLLEQGFGGEESSFGPC